MEREPAIGTAYRLRGQDTPPAVDGESKRISAHKVGDSGAGKQVRDRDRDRDITKRAPTTTGPWLPF
jgi:hypothetical protein